MSRQVADIAIGMGEERNTFFDIRRKMGHCNSQCSLPTAMTIDVHFLTFHLTWQLTFHPLLLYTPDIELLGANPFKTLS